MAMIMISIMRMMIMTIMKEEEEYAENAYDDGVLNWGTSAADDNTSEINNGADAQK